MANENGKESSGPVNGVVRRLDGLKDFLRLGTMPWVYNHTRRHWRLSHLRGFEIRENGRVVFTQRMACGRQGAQLDIFFAASSKWAQCSKCEALEEEYRPFL